MSLGESQHTIEHPSQFYMERATQRLLEVCMKEWRENDQLTNVGEFPGSPAQETEQQQLPLQAFRAYNGSIAMLWPNLILFDGMTISEPWLPEHLDELDLGSFAAVLFEEPKTSSM